MSMLDIHTQAMQGTATVYHEFLLRYKKNERFVYGLVEGKEDPMFYRGIIEQALPKDWDAILIQAGDRDKVLNTYNDFDWDKFPPNRICFFVDRDLTEFVGKKTPVCSNLYVTDNYSIENELAQFCVFRRVIEEIYNINNLSQSDMEKIKSMFETNTMTFREALASVMAQIVIWRRAGERPTLNDIRVKDYFKFDTGRLQLLPNFVDWQARVKHAANCVGLPASDSTSIAACESEFRANKGLERFVRGKYYLWFFLECSSAIHADIASIVGKKTKPPKLNVSMGQKNAMIFVAPRMRCPDSLRSFLNQTFVSFATEWRAPVSGPRQPAS
ncbi:DUF4435 domain-containing protein [Ralstonia pseudosolanacearum]|uniref:DUF4435 domain-containing protein n=1 Tax=Ralstonia pseudosolanacearum TaxID=1310165 RepID=UPI002674FE30|nr:DUF4435 domain-containing protein [Ralstonia pseudosolanacearum]MDO3514865.1 DUF4435 domain-containing protein [Ralstonia pseudosolanacearum]MDO3633498.1 DUF4435 domain-containing protein [Ralstonia pseudosolanacearum]